MAILILTASPRSTAVGGGEGREGEARRGVGLLSLTVKEVVERAQEWVGMG